MSQVPQLYRLQQIDSEISSKKQRLRDVVQGQRETAALRAARERGTATAAALRAAEASMEDVNLALGGVNDKAQRSEQRLYSGKVTNPKELSDLQNEIEALGRRRAALEDDLLEAMILLEEAQVESEEAAASLSSTEASWEADQTHLKAEQNDLALELHGLLAKRATMANGIDAQLLSDYEALKARKGGVAVAALVDHSCTGCHVRMPENKVMQAERGELVFCSGCGRILCLVQRA